MTGVFIKVEIGIQTCTKGSPCEDTGKDNHLSIVLRDASEETSPANSLILDFSRIERKNFFYCLSLPACGSSKVISVSLFKSVKSRIIMPKS